MIYLILVLLLLAAVVWVVLTLPPFGKLPDGPRLARLQAQPAYKDGAVQNLLPTPMQPEGVSMFTMLRAFLKKDSARRPDAPLVPAQPDFSKAQQSNQPLQLTWFGHSSYLIQDGQRSLLVDPVFSERTSPFSFLGTRCFDGMNFISADQLPTPDVVLLTHDHYDHLDYSVIQAFRAVSVQFVCSLGVGAHLERWGIAPGRIHELAWSEAAVVAGFSLRAVPARHFSGRLFKRNQTFWSAFVLETTGNRIFLGGDSGYGPHFGEIGALYGPFDLAILECGQYNAYWPYIHMFPEETVTAAQDLQAAALLPVHWAKFTLAMHAWNEPVIRVRERAQQLGMPLFTPRPGQTFSLAEAPAETWWENGPHDENVRQGA